MWICQYCETENGENGSFCSCCGQPRTRAPAAPAGEQGGWLPQEQGQAYAPQARPPRRRMGLLIGAICLLLAVCLGLTMLLIMRPWMKNSEAALPPVPSPQLGDTTSPGEQPSPSTPIPSAPTESAPTPATPTVPPPAASPSPTPLPSPVLSQIGNDLSAYQKITVFSASASSELTYNGEVFSASYAVDGLLGSSWQENAPGMGEGETLTLRFNGEQELSVIQIYPGFQLNTQAFQNNGRPKTLRFCFSDGSSCEWSFPDEMGGYALKLNAPVRTSYVRVVLVEAYSAPWEDMAISEISFYQ